MCALYAPDGIAKLAKKTEDLAKVNAYISWAAAIEGGTMAFLALCTWNQIFLGLAGVSLIVGAIANERRTTLPEDARRQRATIP